MMSIETSWAICSGASDPEVVVDLSLNIAESELVLLGEAKRFMAYKMASIRQEYEAMSQYPDVNGSQRTYDRINQYHGIHGYRIACIDPEHPDFLGMFANRIWIGRNYQ